MAGVFSVSDGGPKRHRPGLDVHFAHPASGIEYMNFFCRHAEHLNGSMINCAVRPNARLGDGRKLLTHAETLAG